MKDNNNNKDQPSWCSDFFLLFIHCHILLLIIVIYSNYEILFRADYLSQRREKIKC